MNCSQQGTKQTSTCKHFIASKTTRRDQFDEKKTCSIGLRVPVFTQHRITITTNALCPFSSSSSQIRSRSCLFQFKYHIFNHFTVLFPLLTTLASAWSRPFFPTSMKRCRSNLFTPPHLIEIRFEVFSERDDTNECRERIDVVYDKYTSVISLSCSKFDQSIVLFRLVQISLRVKKYFELLHQTERFLSGWKRISVHRLPSSMPREACFRSVF